MVLQRQLLGRKLVNRCCGWHPMGRKWFYRSVTSGQIRHPMGREWVNRYCWQPKDIQQAENDQNATNNFKTNIMGSQKTSYRQRMGLQILWVAKKTFSGSGLSDVAGPCNILPAGNELIDHIGEPIWHLWGSEWVKGVLCGQFMWKQPSAPSLSSSHSTDHLC